MILRRDRDRLSGSVLVGLALLALLVLFGAAPAQAAITHKLAGTFNEGGTLSEPGPIAVDTSTGSVYVVTGGSSFAGAKVEKFDASGTRRTSPSSGPTPSTPARSAASGGSRSTTRLGSTTASSTRDEPGTTSASTAPSGQLVESYRFSHVFREGFSNNEGTYCGVAVDSSGNLYIRARNGFFEDGAYTDKFHPGRWKVNPSPPQIWPVAGVFQQPEDGGTCKISSDANQFLYTAPENSPAPAR